MDKREDGGVGRTLVLKKPDEQGRAWAGKPNGVARKGAKSAWTFLPLPRDFDCELSQLKGSLFSTPPHPPKWAVGGEYEG